MAEVQRRPGRPGPPPGRGPPTPTSVKPSAPRFEPVDREKTCPLLLRVFTKVGDHHADGDFAVRGKEPKDEVQIYTWMDATLRELTDLRDFRCRVKPTGSVGVQFFALFCAIHQLDLQAKVKEVAPEARRRDAILSFAFVYPDKCGRFVVREVGRTFSYPNGRWPDSGSKAFGDLSFQIGDYVDVAILTQ